MNKLRKCIAFANEALRYRVYLRERRGMSIKWRTTFRQWRSRFLIEWNKP